jgi:adenylate kinase family enzyme
MYKRIFIFGGTGSGKTTLAKRLSKLSKIPYYTTDDMVYKIDWGHKRTEKEKKEILKQTAKKTKWIIEGVHGQTWLNPAVKRAEFIILLDIKLSTLLTRVTKRYFREEKQHYSGLKSLIKMLYWSYIYRKDAYLQHKEHIRKNKKSHIVLKNNKEIEEFLRKF